MPLTSTTNLYNFSKYIVGAGLPYTTIQSAINAANAAGGGTVIVHPGAYAENLTLYTNIDIVGAEGSELSSNIVITGVHVPPLAGVISFKNVRLDSATHVFSSAGAGTTNIYLDEVKTIVANGYVFNLTNWTGTLSVQNSILDGIQNGFCNNTAAATLDVSNSTVGAGGANTSNISGITNFFDVELKCPVDFQSASVLAIMNSIFRNTITLSNTSSGQFFDSVISTGANIAITHNSTGLLDLATTSIDSSAVNVITGTGSIQLGSVTYLDSTGVAGTIVKDFTTRLETGVLKLNDATAGVLVATAGTVSATTPLGVTNGGTGLAVAAVGDLIYSSAVNTWSPLIFTNTATRYLTNTGGGATIPAWDQVNLANGVTGTLVVGNGGTGQITNTIHGVLIGNAANAINTTAAGTANQVLQSGGAGADPNWSTATYPATAAVGDVIYGSALNTISGLAFDGTATRYLANTGGAGTLPAWNRINLSNGVTGELNVANGGTGVSSLTNHGVLIGQDIADIVALGAANTGELLTGVSGADPVFATSSTGNFTFTSATAGQLRTLTVSNTDATGANYSAANVLVVAQSGSTGDPFIRLDINGGQDYSFGPDNSASDILKITDDINPSTGNILWSMTSAGERTMPLQPAFLATHTADQGNVTGDGTVATSNYTTEIFDQNSDYDGTSTFTAPVTGKYAFYATLYMTNIGAGHTAGHAQLVTSNRTYKGLVANPANIRQAANDAVYTFGSLADMDSGDTAYITGEVHNSTKTVGFGPGDGDTFSGFLVC